MKRARDAAEAAAEQARVAASAASKTANDPATAERLNKGARDAMGAARKGVNTVIERIDPGTLAELIIKATALQEMTNKALRVKESPYRISEISIAASIPPGVTFAISRLDNEPEEIGADTVSSSELVESGDVGETVLALDGTTADAATELAAILASGTPEAMPPSLVHREGGE
jgi:hypothetical protein